MAKFISKGTKRNVAKVQQRLDNERVTIKMLGLPDRTMLAGEALLLGGRLLLDRQEYQALQFADQLLKKYDDIIDVHLLKIRALIQLERLVEARETLDRLLKEAPDNIGVVAAAARYEIIVGDIDSALKYLSLLVRRQPDNIDALFRLAECYRLTGEQGKAKKCINRCVTFAEKKIDRGKDAEREYRAALLRLVALGDVAPVYENELRGLLNNEKADLEMRADIAFSLAKKAEREKDIDEEIRLLELANRWQAETIGYGLSATQIQNEYNEQLTAQKKIYPNEAPEWLNGFESGIKEAPIFILGMPRSGTTLMEQMLGSHSLVGQVGESKGLVIGIEQAYMKHQPGFALPDYPKRFDKLPEQALHDIASYYVEHQRLLTEKGIYIDKELSSFRYVGIVSHLFPRAKFIHMNRAPLDIFLSCYRGVIPGIPATCNIEHLAHYYIYMKKLIGHWKSIYPDKVYVLDYASLVNDPERQIKQVLEFLNLEFEPQIMEFHKRKNVVRTLSVDQVRQKIYKTAVKKWLPFADMLEPARKILEDNGIGENGVAIL